LPFDGKLQGAGGIQRGGDFADAEFDGLRVGFLIGCSEAQRKFVEVLRAHAVGPPQFGILDLQLRIGVGEEAGGARFVRLQCVGLVKLHVVELGFESAGDFFVCSVVQLGFDRQISLRERRGGE